MRRLLSTYSSTADRRQQRQLPGCSTAADAEVSETHSCCGHASTSPTSLVESGNPERNTHADDTEACQKMFESKLADAKIDHIIAVPKSGPRNGQEQPWTLFNGPATKLWRADHGTARPTSIRNSQFAIRRSFPSSNGPTAKKIRARRGMVQPPAR